MMWLMETNKLQHQFGHRENNSALKIKLLTTILADRLRLINRATTHPYCDVWESSLSRKCDALGTVIGKMRLSADGASVPTNWYCI